MIHRVLGRACPDVHVDSLRPLDAGYTSKQWIAETDQGRVLVKVPQRDRDPEHLRKLVATTRLAAEHGIPVVRHRHLVDHDPDVDGPVLIQDFHEGDTASDVWDSLDETGRKTLCQDLGDVVGRIHTIKGARFGEATTLHESVETEVDDLLTRTGAFGTGAAVRTATMAAVSRLDSTASVPALVHGDLWLPNFLVSDGRVTRVLDFEHATRADRFRDFGKLDEHVFDAFPAGRGVFLESYATACPMPDDWEQRVDLAHVLHALTMHVYFLKWSPRWAPQYARQVTDWLARNS
jgi:aminoglycoside phosphotransferase (APT) family kinase protein